MLRSWMFIPGNQDKHLKKAEELSADALIFDLEDAVPGENKEIARYKVKNIMTNLERRLNFVRVNAISTSHFLEDIRGTVNQNLTGIILPMTNNKEEVVTVDYMLGQMEMKYELPAGSITIVPIIESASGLHHAYEIATASKRVSRLVFGAEDFKLDLHIEPDEEQAELLYARSRLVNISRAAGIEAPIDTVYTNFKDGKGLEKAAQKGRKLGFQGKLVIHPEQIQTVNQVFTPTTEEILNAKRIVEKYDAAVGNGTGVIQVDGKMVDVPVAERARKILSIAGVNQ